jgi:hypothetical protein
VQRCFPVWFLELVHSALQPFDVHLVPHVVVVFAASAVLGCCTNIAVTEITAIPINALTILTDFMWLLCCYCVELSGSAGEMG